MLRRLLTHVVDIVMPESQYGFRRGRSSIDMILVDRLLQEKCREQNCDLFLAFIDLTKACDKVNRDLLWNVLSKFRCPPNFLSIVQEFHNGMKTNVAVDGRMSDPFNALVGEHSQCSQGSTAGTLKLSLSSLISDIIRQQVKEESNVCHCSRLRLLKTRRLYTILYAKLPSQGCLIINELLMHTVSIH